MNRLDAPGGGALLLTSFPGLDDAVPSDWRSSIVRGLERVAASGARTLITLVERATLARYDVPDYGDLVRDAGLDWRHLPIADFSTPDAGFMAAWREASQELHRRLDDGETIAIHCRAGLGRTGTVAALILIERGLTPEEAIRQVRRSRPGTIETDAQQAWVNGYRGQRA